MVKPCATLRLRNILDLDFETRGPSGFHSYAGYPATQQPSLLPERPRGLVGRGVPQRAPLGCSLPRLVQSSPWSGGCMRPSAVQFTGGGTFRPSRTVTGSPVYQFGALAPTSRRRLRSRYLDILDWFVKCATRRGDGQGRRELFRSVVRPYCVSSLRRALVW